MPEMFAQQLAGNGVQQTNMRGIPLHLNMASDPAWRRAVIGGLHFHTAIQVHGALAVLVTAERFDGQRKQRRLPEPVSSFVITSVLLSFGRTTF